MTRKTLDFTIEAEGRDKGKCYRLTEMGAAKAERWAVRAFRSLLSSGADLSEVGNLGMESIAMLGMRALSQIPYHEAEPLLDEMFDCVSFKPDPKHPNVIRPLIEDDIEEIGTRLLLRAEVFKLHVGFLKAGSLSTSA